MRQAEPAHLMVLRRALLATILVLPCALGMLTSYVLAGLVVLGAAALAFRRELHAPAPALVFLGCFAATALVVVATAQAPHDYLYVLNMIALAFAPVLWSALGRGGAGHARIVADLSLLGTAVGLTVALAGGGLAGAPRAATLLVDPIRLADTCVILGLLALVGYAAAQGRWWHLLAPPMALAVVFLSGSRGALLAFPLVLVLAVLMLVRSRRAALGLVAVAAVGTAGLVALGAWLGARSATMPGIVAELLSGAPVQDAEVGIRLAIYRAGWQSFLDSPLFGHGWVNLMTSIAPYLPEAYRAFASLPHLHNEALNFAVFGGLLGIAVYLALLSLPLVAALRSPRDGQYRARLFGGTILAASYFLLGLPDTMLSFELHTALYVGLSAVLLAYCRDGTVPLAPPARGNPP